MQAWAVRWTRSRTSQSHNLKVVEDAVIGIMASYKGKPLGTFGDFGAFSFQVRLRTSAWVRAERSLSVKRTSKGLRYSVKRELTEASFSVVRSI